MSFTLVCIHLGCYNKTPRLGRLWTTTFYFWQFWRLRVQVQGVSMAGLLAKALLRDADCWLLPVSSHGRRRDLALWGFIFKGTNPSREGSWPNRLQNFFITSPWMLKFQHEFWEVTNIQTISHLLWDCHKNICVCIVRGKSEIIFQKWHKCTLWMSFYISSQLFFPCVKEQS